MIAFGLYLIAVLFGAAGLLGHAPLLPRLARSALAWRTRRGSRGSRVLRAVPGPSSARTAPSWARTDHNRQEAA